MAHQQLELQLDSNADHELSDDGTSGTVYIAMQNDVSVEIYFEADSRQNIKLLSVGDALIEIDGIHHDYEYTLQAEHEPAIKAVINKFLYDNPVDSDDEEERYWDQSTYGFSHSDWLYG